MGLRLPAITQAKSGGLSLAIFVVVVFILSLAMPVVRAFKAARRRTEAAILLAVVMLLDKVQPVKASTAKAPWVVVPFCSTEALIVYAFPRRA